MRKSLPPTRALAASLRRSGMRARSLQTPGAASDDGASAVGAGGGRELAAAGEQLLEQLPAFFSMLEPGSLAPSVLHGDLWAGNTAALGDQTAVVFDPAPYFGDPETDLAMLELFGGPLPEAFLMGYGPMTVDRAKRRPLYDLYHALNHLNLFGASYTSMVRRCLASF